MINVRKIIMLPYYYRLAISIWNIGRNIRRTCYPYHTQGSGLISRSKSQALKNPKRIAKGVSHNNWFIITINEANEIPYALSLIRQAYERS